MKDVLALLLVPGALLLLFVFNLLVSVKRRKMGYVYMAILSFLLSIASGIYVFYVFYRNLVVW